MKFWKCSFFLLFIVANNEIPSPALRVPTMPSLRRLSTEKPQQSTRHSKRFSRQESLVNKSRRFSKQLYDQNIQEDNEDNTQTTSNDVEDENGEQKQESDKIDGTTDCSIM